MTRSKVENMHDHMALTCECGSVNFALLRSDGIECNKCGKRMPMEWREYDAYECPECGGAGRQAKSAAVDNSGYTLDYWEHCETCDGLGWVGPDAEKRAAVESALHSRCGCRMGECESKPHGCHMAEEARTRDPEVM